MSAKKLPLNGKPESTPIGLLSKRQHTLPSEKLQRLLRAVYNSYQRLDDPAANATARQDFAFHMTDWMDDLERLAAMYAQPDEFSKAAADDIVYAFIIHAVPHLMEAGRLLEGRPLRNPFVDSADTK